MSDPYTQWTQFSDALDPQRPLPAVIAQSWERCEAAGMDRTPADLPLRQVGDDELRRRRKANAHWLAIARPHMRWLASPLARIPHVVYLTDRDGIVLDSVGSPSLTETFGLSPGFDWSESRLGTNGAGTALVAGQPVAVVGQQHYLGALADCTCTAAPVHGPDGSLVGAIDISTSVADGSPERLAVVAHTAFSIGRELSYARQELSLRHAEQSLRDSRDRFHQLANAMPQMVWVARPDGFHEYFNRRWYEYTGCQPAECLGHTWSLTLHPDDRQRAISRWNSALRSGDPYEIEYRFRSESGDYRWFLGRALAVRDDAGRIVHWFGTCTDIEEMKRADEALRQSEARYRAAEERLSAALAASESGTFRWHPGTGTFLDFDDSLKRLFGLGPEESIRTTEDFINRVHPDDRPILIPAIARSRDGAAFEMEYRVVRPDGQVRWLYDRARMMHDAEGRPSYLVGACIDITNRKRIEETLKDADRRKDEFLATLAHELRNPLAPIRTGLEVLKLAGGDQELADETRTVMEQQLEQMVRLIDDLLEVSRITRGKLELRKQQTELADAIQAALDATSSLFDQADHTLDVVLPPEPIYVDADPVRLSQIFSNLLSNAAKYTERGGRIEVRVERQEEHVVIAVRDNGIGISAEDQSKLFVMFSQVGSALERAKGGLGIGLALVRELVEMHGGTVDAHSSGPGRGSQFIVRLPLPGTMEPKPRAPAAAELPSPRELGRRILVVDDNQDAARMLSTVLKALGNKVHTVFDGAEAIEAAAQFRPHLVLLDIGMPKVNGYEAARSIRAQPWGREPILVAVTGWGQDEDKRRALEAGFDYHLTKPVETAAIQKLLEENSR